MKITVLIVLFTCFAGAVWGQDSLKTEKMIKYTIDFKFKDGIYLNVEQFKNNSPIPKSRIITRLDYSQVDFFEELLSQDVIFMYNSLGLKVDLDVKKIWGFSKNGLPYIQKNRTFNRIPIFGMIAYFIANETINHRTHESYNRIGSHYSPYESTYTTTEMRQYIFDFEMGIVMDYELKSLETILMRDPELYDEFNALKKRKKRKALFLYLRKYNERHPVYFPIAH